MNPDSAGKTVELETVLEALLKEQGFEHKMIEQKIFDGAEDTFRGISIAILLRI